MIVQNAVSFDAIFTDIDRPIAPGSGGVDEDLESEAEGVALVEWWMGRLTIDI